MSRWTGTVFTLLVVLCATQTTVAQIEKQAQTYDLTLEDCLALAFRQNPDIRRQRADVERAMGTKVIYRARALPQLAAQAPTGFRAGSLYEPNTVGSNSTAMKLQLFGILTAQFSQPLIDVGIPPTLRRATLEVILAQQNLLRVVTEQLYETRVAFLQALSFRDLVAVHEEIDKRLQANVLSEQQRLDIGMGNEAALKSAKIQQLNLELDLAYWRGAYFTAVTRIAELCGRDPSETADGTRQLRLPKPVGALRYEPETVDLAQETAYALQHRADLKLLQALVDATAADKQTVQAGYFPLVSLTASALFIPQSLLLHKETAIVPGQDTRTSEVRAGVALSWQVIDNGRVIGASHRLEAARQGYEITLHKLEQNIPRELATIEGALRSADARYAALTKSAEDAEENLRLIETQISLGQATQLDFLKAQNNLLSVRAGLVDATQSQAIAHADLDRATGRYLQYPDEDAQ
jgi:outer membrane protein TolC